MKNEQLPMEAVLLCSMSFKIKKRSLDV